MGMQPPPMRKSPGYMPCKSPGLAVLSSLAPAAPAATELLLLLLLLTKLLLVHPAPAAAVADPAAVETPQLTPARARRCSCPEAALPH